MAQRVPPPSYDETLARGEDALTASPFNSNTGRPVSLDYRSTPRVSPTAGGRRGSGGGAATAPDVMQSLRGPGFKVRRGVQGVEQAGGGLDSKSVGKALKC